MFDEIYNEPLLYNLTRELCDENDISVSVSEKISEDDYIILKIDRYYNSRNIHNPPPSVDCLIIVKCHENECYDLYLVELKNVKSTKGFKIKKIIEKFKTTIDDFMSIKFPHIFLNEDYCINTLNMYFVSDVLRIKKKHPDITDDQYRKRIKNTKLEVFQSVKPIKFRNKIAHINPMLPNPMVKPC